MTMFITGKGWNALTLGEKLAVLSNAVATNKKRKVTKNVG